MNMFDGVTVVFECITKTSLNLSFANQLGPRKCFMLVNLVLKYVFSWLISLVLRYVFY